MAIKYLYPVQDADVIEASMAPRLETLEGKTLGLLANAKANSHRLHEMIGEELNKKFGLAEIKFINKGHAGTNCAPEIIEELAGTVDAVITGLGD